MGQVIPFIQNPEYFFKQGVSSYQNKDWRRSIRYLKRAIELRPLEGVFHCQLAAVLSDMAQYERSNEILLHVLDHVDEHLYDCYYFLANNYACLGLFDKAREAALHYLSGSPEGEFIEDTKELLEVINLEEDDDFFTTDDEFVLRYERVGRLIAEKHYQKAEKLLGELLKEYPDHDALYNQYARALHLQGRSDEAIDCLQALLEETTYVPAVCQLTLLLEDQQDRRKAERWKKQLRQLAPLNKAHMHKWAATLCRLGEYEQAFLAFLFLQRHGTPDKGGAFFYRYGVAAFHCGYANKSKNAWKLARDYGHHGADILLQKWKRRDLEREEVQCERMHDLSFGLD
ncbi:tetratricopeptide repeat protein [Natribacillus halophilus]|uniref:Tetratricopeptide repeat-containing protein n=1 Tax=Natribacillus halophilus TaxID=549003 RepID=A0A1G8KLG8_9BACI|nr:tetratricopeptide repeat protein [Natribacillus halophilus]SDI44226.1 Tetratricopeptide repeat-containing protein [Natribacillus halophilus]